jgi:hypothetical protein
MVSYHILPTAQRQAHQLIFIMGVKNGAKTLHSISGLSLTDISRMCKGLVDEKKILPRIVSGCSNLLFMFSKCTSVMSAVADH